MANFQYRFHGLDDLQDAAFDWLEQGHYLEAIEGFQEVISRIEYKSKHVKNNHCGKILGNLGKLHRGLAEALWRVNKPQDALRQIQWCISQKYHEYSEVRI